MKTVFTNDMCAHTWAQMIQSHGRSQSMKFDGPTIYSYSTAIARIYQKENLALVNERTYSKTTSCKHMPAVTRALSIPFVRVPHVYPFASKGEHTENQDYLLDQYNKEAARLRRARYVSDYDYLGKLQHNAALYATAFKLKTPPMSWQKDRADIRAFRDEREKRLNTPAAIAKRERNAAKREEYAANALAKKAAILKERSAAQITAFRCGDTRSVYGLPYALLRLSKDGQTVETSQGASVPVEDAKSAVLFIATVRMRGKAWAANGERLHVGNFQVSSIAANGNIIAGCHQIEWDEVRQLGWLLGVASMLHDLGQAYPPDCVAAHVAPGFGA